MVYLEGQIHYPINPTEDPLTGSSVELISDKAIPFGVSGILLDGKHFPFGPGTQCQIRRGISMGLL